MKSKKPNKDLSRNVALSKDSSWCVALLNGLFHSFAAGLCILRRQEEVYILGVLTTQGFVWCFQLTQLAKPSTVCMKTVGKLLQVSWLLSLMYSDARHVYAYVCDTLCVIVE